MTLKASFPPAVRADARLLVLGSLPGDRSLAAGRYYAHPQNQFWHLMAPVIGCDLPALRYDDRLAALLDARVGLWDAVATARRPGSGDAALRDIIVNALPDLIAVLPGLRAVAFNGVKAGAIGRVALRGAFGGALLDLPSSSPLHTIGRAAKQPAWSALASFLA
jgi:hypoxanthine-DNA glycosylase